MGGYSNPLTEFPLGSRLALRKIDLTDLPQGQLKLLVAFATDDLPWGEYEILKNTSWEQGITEVSGESFSHALHGWLVPLKRELGRKPEVSASRITDEEGSCSLHGACVGWNAAFCRPSGKAPDNTKESGPPRCYEAPVIREDPQGRQQALKNRLAFAWKEGRHSVVVVGSEFNLG